MYDIAIIGAGPAGATLARLIGRKYKILLLDRRNLLTPEEGTIEKCCGGLIAPDAQYMLAKLGLGVPKEVLVGPQLFTVRTIDIPNMVERYYQRHYINIDREKFDAWLVSLIPPSVDIRCGCSFKSFETSGENIRINFLSSGKEYRAEAKLLVGADGAHSRVRAQLAPKLAPKAYIAIQEWFKVQESLPYFSAIFDHEISDFYSWTIPKEEYLLVGAAVSPGANSTHKFELLKSKLQNYGFEFGQSVKKNGAFILRPEKVRQIFPGQGRVALVGEAAGWISPTSAEGLSYAFKSAIALAQSLQQNPDNCLGQYFNNTKDLRRNIFSKNLKAPFMYNSTIRKTVMQLGIASMAMSK